MKNTFTEKFKLGEIERIKRLDIQELIEETICSAAGDSYDGSFTLEGEFTDSELRKELSKRLLELKIIKKPLFEEIEIR